MIFLFVFVCSAGDWTQGLAHVRQVLCSSCVLGPLCFVCLLACLFVCLPLRFKHWYVWVLACIYVCAQCLRRPEGCVRSPGTGVAGGEPPCGCWKLNSGPLWEQSVLLTAEHSLQPVLCGWIESLLCSLGQSWVLYPLSPQPSEC